MKKLILVGIMLSSLLCATFSFAAPNLINYQGQLTDDVGTPINGSVEMTFALYDAVSGGTLFWSETETVTVTRGFYDAVFGDDVTLDLPFDEQYFLGITVTGESEMVPRTPLTTVGSTIKAGTAESINQPVTTAQFQDGAVTSSKLANSCNIGEILVMTASGWGCGPSPH